MKRLPTLVILTAFLVLVYLIYTNPAKDQKKIANEMHEAMSPPKQPVLVTQVAVDPQNSERLYVSTSNAGIFKSLDRGRSWTSAQEGLKTLTVLDLVIDPHRPQVLYAATFGGGVYRSENEGASWIEANEGLGNTAISKVVFHPSDPDTLYALSLTEGVYERRGDRNWTPLTSGISLLEPRSNFALLPLPVAPATLYLGANEGILALEEKESLWKILDSPFKGKLVAALAYNPKSQVLIAAVISQGLFLSADLGKSWRPIGTGLTKGGIYSIAFDPSNPLTLYAASTERGVLKSNDGGETWTEINGAIEKNMVMRVAVDPRDPQRLYAAPSQGGLLVSTDSGKNWTPLDTGFPDVAMVTQSFSDHIGVAGNEGAKTPAPPEVFKKCNTCHGWTDPLLDLKPGIWKITPSHREWTLTVKRMRKVIPDLTDAEEATLIQFLNTNFGQGAVLPGKGQKG